MESPYIRVCRGRRERILIRIPLADFFNDLAGDKYRSGEKDLKISRVVAEKDMKAKAIREIHHSYLSRIEFLREEAVAEGIIFNKDSERDFWMFIELVPFVRRGSLFLMDNGDLRVVWDDDKDNLLGLQFLGNFLARYVVFKHRAEDGPVSRVAGTDTLKGVNAQIEAFQLGTLLSL